MEKIGTKYLRIKKDIENKINNGNYKSGEKIPSERKLCELYSISRMTARQAINELVKDGTVYREKGRGTFVSSPNFLQRNVKSFTDTLRERGFIPKTEIIEFSTVYNLKEISRMMGVPAETKFYKIKRLRLGNDLPMALETVYIQKDKCLDLDKHDISNSLYEILEKYYGYKIENISCDIDACIANNIMMKIFNMKKARALLKISGISYTQDGKKVFYEESYYRPDLYKYRVDIHRRV
ncbi:phosphonate metabolism transcriptional regulator PhnF [Vallitalea longa]|uniref:Phosphonate metabolism transcriptional regulator PhnF n=1 Tax=Vallitalea longa TaxID=2936439 RepID=A0A9W5Y7X2_9FIRM|nr:GntR family transcriptional regulator [Vallitalea longa]GKX28720.1 phosphonate metabolism transcriptional regulator PhnF [Vallitalea longa]